MVHTLLLGRLKRVSLESTQDFKVTLDKHSETVPSANEV